MLLFCIAKRQVLLCETNPGSVSQRSNVFVIKYEELRNAHCNRVKGKVNASWQATNSVMIVSVGLAEKDNNESSIGKPKINSPTAACFTTMGELVFLKIVDR